MDLVGISINHRNSPVELRETLHLSSDEIYNLIPILKGTLSEGFILSTCNRTEIFGFNKTHSLDISSIINGIATVKKMDKIDSKNVDRYFSCGAVRHIFSVATGIDSLVLGDSQILGQIKESFEISRESNFAGHLTTRLFDNTIKVGRRAIKETGIGEGAVSVSYAAVQVVEMIFTYLSKKSALIIGAGETAELAALHLRDKGIGNITIANRTNEKAIKLAEKVHGEVVGLNDVDKYLHNFDIIFSATSAENYILSKDQIKKMMKKRKGTPVILMDIAIPRDIDPRSGDIDNVFYHDIDSLKIIVEQNLNNRKKEIPVVHQIIMEEMEHFFGWYNSLEVVPTIRSIRDFFEDIRQDELVKIRHKVTDEDYEKLENMTRRMIGRLLHNPTVKLKEIAESGAPKQEIASVTYVAKELFGVDSDKYKNNGAKIG